LQKKQLMKIYSFVFNPFFENTYLLSNESGDTWIIDPGCYEKHEQQTLLQYISDHGLTPLAIINTHCHIDHVLGNEFCKRSFDIPLWIPEKEQEMLTSVKVYAPGWGITGYQPAEPDRTIRENEVLSLGDVPFQVLEAPGHSPGHQMLYQEASEILIAGDVIFRESIGRTDLPGGNHEQLLQEIQKKVYTLPENTTIYPGHGPETSVGHERTHNPFVKG
jgi:glyoxylase-like metal-dependent hydrolase (beta-lactamase superfamily II)